MVKIISAEKRMNSEGESFNALILQGGVELVMSKETGRFYATAKQASVPSTFDEETCKDLIGTELPGSVKKVECEPY